jgi:ABC-2 type transport system permease protein
MSALASAESGNRLQVLTAELLKLPAFLRRDLLIAWSYRMSFVTDWVGLAVQAVMFGFIAKMIDPAKLPTFGGTRAGYMEFVAIGIALGVFVQLGFGQVAAGIRQEQLIGTLESVLVTPTAPATIQLGSVIYQLIYIPIRTALFLVLIAVGFGLHFHASGVLPATLIILAFIPFVWGLGVASAAATLTYRRGAGAFGLGVGLLTLLSGAYFPIGLLPHWLGELARLNPVTLAIDGMREALIGGTGWSQVGFRLVVLLPVSAVSLCLGILAFRRAMRREQRLGTLGLY